MVVEMKNKSITLAKFFASKERLFVHCNTEAKAERLLKAFYNLGKTWMYGESYLNNNYWNHYCDKTIYSNDGLFSSVDFCKESNVTIYEFEDINWGQHYDK